MFNLFKKKKKALLPPEQQKLIVAAIQEAEQYTSGEIRVFVESRCNYMDAMDRASELFFKLGMDKTKHHNAVLVYVALVDHQLALYGDEGIFKKTGGNPYWIKEVNLIRDFFREGQFAEGIAAGVRDIGRSLQTHFPYDARVDKNELPDDIVFGH